MPPDRARVSLRPGRKGLASDGLRLRCFPWRSQGRFGYARVSLRLGRKGLASDGLRLRCFPWRSQGRFGYARVLGSHPRV